MTAPIIPENQNKEQQDWIAITTSILVGLLAIGAFSLSYDALQGIANDAGIEGWKSYVWPFLIDFALIVFSLAVVRNERLREKVEWPWILVGFFTFATIVFNVLHSLTIGEETQKYLSPIMAAIAPVAFVLAFETLMSQLRQHISRDNKIKNIAQMTATVARLQAKIKSLALDLGELVKRIKTHQASLNTLDRELSAKSEAKNILAGKINEMRPQVASLHADHKAATQLIENVEAKRGEADVLNTYLVKVQTEIEKAESRLKTLNQKTENVYTSDDLKGAHFLGQNPDATGNEIAMALGRTSATFGNSLKKKLNLILNGEITNGNR